MVMWLAARFQARKVFPAFVFAAIGAASAAAAQPDSPVSMHSDSGGQQVSIGRFGVVEARECCDAGLLVQCRAHRGIQALFFTQEQSLNGEPADLKGRAFAYGIRRAAPWWTKRRSRERSHEHSHQHSHKSGSAVMPTDASEMGDRLGHLSRTDRPHFIALELLAQNNLFGAAIEARAAADLANALEGMRRHNAANQIGAA